MRLVGFQVQMYRCVMDSTWIPVTPLTVLVGKNESGKTAVLKALHKLNPFHPEPYHLREWPRGHRGARSTDQVARTAEPEPSAPAAAWGAPAGGPGCPAPPSSSCPQPRKPIWPA